MTMRKNCLYECESRCINGHYSTGPCGCKIEYNHRRQFLPTSNNNYNNTYYHEASTCRGGGGGSYIIVTTDILHLKLKKTAIRWYLTPIDFLCCCQILLLSTMSVFTQTGSPSLLALNLQHLQECFLAVIPAEASVGYFGHVN